jgi:hypothetical protein
MVENWTALGHYLASPPLAVVYFFPIYANILPNPALFPVKFRRDRALDPFTLSYDGYPKTPFGNRYWPIQPS